MRIFATFTLLFFSSICWGQVAIFINGGWNEQQNGTIFNHEIDKMYKTFNRRWTKYVYADDGLGSDGPPNAIKYNNKGYYILDEEGKQIAVRSYPKSPTDGSANYSNISSKIDQLVAPGNYQLKNGEPLFISFNGHGLYRSPEGEGKDEPTIPLWNETIDRDQLASIVDRIPQSSNIAFSFNFCFAQMHLEAVMYDDEGNLRPNVCGFAEAGKYEYAKTTGGLPLNIKQKTKKVDLNGDRKQSLSEIFQHYERNDAIRKDSHPISSSDIYLTKYFDAHRSKSNKIEGNFYTLTQECCQTFFNDPYKDLSYLSDQTEIHATQKELDNHLAALAKELKIKHDYEKNIVNDQEAVFEDFEAYPNILDDIREDYEKDINDLYPTIVNIVWKYTEKLAKERGIMPQTFDVMTEAVGNDLHEKLTKINGLIFKQLSSDRRNVYINSNLQSFYQSLTPEEVKSMPNSKYLPDLLKEYKTLVWKKHEAQNRKIFFQRYLKTLKKINAIKMITDLKDEKALKEYLQLKRCEEGVIVR